MFVLHWAKPETKELWNHSPWEQSVLLNAADAYRQLSEMSSRYRLPYQDHDAILIDLESPLDLLER